MTRLIVAVAIVAVAAIVAAVVRRRRAADAPTQPRHQVPTQLDRDDFAQPSAPWLVAVFTSDTCSTCADVASKAEVMRCDELVVDVVSFQARRRVHDRYAIDAVPCVVLADAGGVVRASFVGPVTATDLWAAFAEARHPGTTGGACA